MPGAAYPDESFDVVDASCFCTNFAMPRGGTVTGRADKWGGWRARGILGINDLQRHPLAYAGIYGLHAPAAGFEMMQKDGPISVLRGFEAREPTIRHRTWDSEHVSIQWCWAFRWLLEHHPLNRRPHL